MTNAKCRELGSCPLLRKMQITMRQKKNIEVKFINIAYQKFIRRVLGLLS